VHRVDDCGRIVGNPQVEPTISFSAQCKKEELAFHRW
jgi:hypothetical protein